MSAPVVLILILYTVHPTKLIVVFDQLFLDDYISNHDIQLLKVSYQVGIVVSSADISPPLIILFDKLCHVRIGRLDWRICIRLFAVAHVSDSALLY